jgi:hypothetical protein
MQAHSSTWHCEQGLRLLHLCVAALCLFAAGLAPAGTPPALADEALEARFWACDVLATQTVLSSDEGAQCVRWQDELKQRRFGGDFGRLLAWWQAHKADQHARYLQALSQRAAQR